jgi:hypothetical protein
MSNSSSGIVSSIIAYLGLPVIHVPPVNVGLSLLLSKEFLVAQVARNRSLV